MLFMDINDSMIFKESPVKQDIPALDIKQSKSNQDTAELENIISEKDKLIEKMKDEFEGA